MRSLVALLVSGIVLAGRADGRLPADRAQMYLAETLDAQGSLLTALPLYQTRAGQSPTKANRLRYAGALMRAGRGAEAKAVYAQVCATPESADVGAADRARIAAVCASNLLGNGFPEAALEYIGAGAGEEPGEPALVLLRCRALLAAGQTAAARPILAAVRHAAERGAVGMRLELARAYILSGDPSAGRALLDGAIEESVGQMFRASILSDLAMANGEWVAAANSLADAEHKVPPVLDRKRVDRAWQNVQRELRAAQLRKAISLWKIGDRRQAAGAATRARESDQEFVRSAATLLLVAADMSAGHPVAPRLDVLAGHDRRFAAPVLRVEHVVARASDARGALSELIAVLDSQDRSQAVVTSPLLAILMEAAQRSVR